MRYGLAIGLSLVLCGTARVGLAADKEAERLEKSAEVITDIMKTPEKGIPRDLLNKAVCVGVIPSEKKVALGIGGSYGRGAEKFLHDKTKIGADASAAGGPVGRSAEGATDLQLHAEILTYSRSRGAFAGVSLDGQILKPDGDSNEKLYGRKFAPEDILFKGVAPVPSSARPLDTALTQFSPHGGEAFHPK